MSWLGTAGQELDEPQQQALLRIVAAANQNAGADDSEEEDEREFVGDLDEYEEEELDDSDDAEAYEQYDGALQQGDEEVEEGIVEEIDEDEEEEELDATQQAELMKLMQQAQMIRGLEPAQPSTRGAQSAAAGARAQEQWSGLTSMPEPTRLAIEQALHQYKAAGRTSLTVLVLGKAFAGKTATINSMLGETVLDVKPMADVAAKVSMVTRTAHSIALRVIDTPSLAEGDSVNQTALDMIAHAVKQEGPVDVVLYIDRLDGYRVSPLDKEVLSAVSDTLGRGVWSNVVLGLTHAECLPVEGEALYESFCDGRAAGLRKAIAGAGAPKGAVLPLVLIDNRRDCVKDQQGQKLLPDGRAWLPMMVSEIIQASLDAEAPFAYDPKQRQVANPNNRRKWLIPVVVVAQFLFKVLVLDRILEEDGITGDAYGPYDPEYVEDERARRKEEKEADKRAAARRKVKKAGKAKAPAAAKPLVVVDEDSSSSESDDDDADFDLDA